MTDTDGVRPNPELVRQFLRYEDGKLFWNHRPRETFRDQRYFGRWNTNHAGKEAGFIKAYRDGDRRCLVGLEGRQYFRSVLVWVVVRGEWPQLYVDHRNGNTLDDRIGNLRLATTTQNRANSAKHKNNTSGYKGVSRNGPNGRWMATIKDRGKQVYLGTYDDPAKAHEAHVKAAAELHGEFACDGERPELTKEAR